MKVCAITMVYRDHWALGQWYAHYAAMLGPQNLYVVAHGADAEIAGLCPGASIITIPREDLSKFEGRRISFLHGLQQGFLHLYDWVIRTDADELVCADPRFFASVPDALKAHGDAPTVFSLGLDIIEQPNDQPLVVHDPVFSKRRAARPYGHYSKAFAARTVNALAWHGVRVRAEKVPTYPYVLPRGLYMAHLKYANLEALHLANEVRVEVAAVSGVGNNWRKAPERADKYFRECAQLPFADFDVLMPEVYEATLRNVKRDVEKGLVRSKSEKFFHMTRLPDWFGRR